MEWMVIRPSFWNARIHSDLRSSAPLWVVIAALVQPFAVPCVGGFGALASVAFVAEAKQVTFADSKESL